MTANNTDTDTTARADSSPSPQSADASGEEQQQSEDSWSQRTDSSAERRTTQQERPSESPPLPESPFDITSTVAYIRENIETRIPYGHSLWTLSKSLLIAGTIAFLLIYLTGLTSPLVAVSSESMEPNLETGDFVVLVEYAPENPPQLADSPEIVTVEESRSMPGSHKRFNKHGDVIVFKPQDGGTPVIHRAQFWVTEGENWVADADPDYLPTETSCETVTTCPAPTSGYITAGDNNPFYDQLYRNQPVEKEQVIGIAKYRVPYLGWFRVGLNEAA